MTSRRRYQLAPGITLNATHDEALLLNLQAETMFSLNATGASIVTLVTAGQSLDDVVETLVMRYCVERTEVERDVRRLIADLERAGLLVPAASTAPSS